MKRILLVLFIVTKTLIVFSTDCIDKTIKDDWGRADIIFDCKVIKKYENTSIYGLLGKLPYTNVIVKRVYKGQALSTNDTISVIFNNTSADFIFEEDKEYLIFTTATNLLNVNKCSGSIRKESNDYKAIIDSIEFYNTTLKGTEDDYERIAHYDRIVKITKNSPWILITLIASVLLNIILIAKLIKRK